MICFLNQWKCEMWCGSIKTFAESAQTVLVEKQATLSLRCCYTRPNLKPGKRWAFKPSACGRTAKSLQLLTMKTREFKCDYWKSTRAWPAAKQNIKICKKTYNLRLVTHNLRHVPLSLLWKWRDLRLGFLQHTAEPPHVKWEEGKSMAAFIFLCDECYGNFVWARTTSTFLHSFIHEATCVKANRAGCQQKTHCFTHTYSGLPQKQSAVFVGRGTVAGAGGE